MALQYPPRRRIPRACPAMAETKAGSVWRRRPRSERKPDRAHSTAASLTNCEQTPQLLTAEHVGDLLDRRIGRETPRRDFGFEPRQRRLERPIRTQRRKQAFLEHLPHPLHLLLAAPGGKLARGGELFAMLEHLGP